MRPYLNGKLQTFIEVIVDILPFIITNVFHCYCTNQILIQKAIIYSNYTTKMSLKSPKRKGMWYVSYYKNTHAQSHITKKKNSVKYSFSTRVYTHKLSASHVNSDHPPLKKQFIPTISYFYIQQFRRCFIQLLLYYYFHAGVFHFEPSKRANKILNQKSKKKKS